MKTKDIVKELGDMFSAKKILAVVIVILIMSVTIAPKTGAGKNLGNVDITGSKTDPEKPLNVTPAVLHAKVGDTFTVRNLADADVTWHVIKAPPESVPVSTKGTLYQRESKTFDTTSWKPGEYVIAWDPPEMGTANLTLILEKAPPKGVPALTPLSFLLALLSMLGLGAIAMRKMNKR